MKYLVRKASITYMEDVVGEDYSANPKRFCSFVKSYGQESCIRCHTATEPGWLPAK